MSANNLGENGQMLKNKMDAEAISTLAGYVVKRLLAAIFALIPIVLVWNAGLRLLDEPSSLALFGLVFMAIGVVAFVGGALWLLTDARKHFLVLALCLLAFSTSGCIDWTMVKPGYVGVRVNLTGKQRGVQDLPIVTGRVFFNPWTEQIDSFPTFINVRTWTKSPVEGSKDVDESITFNSAEGGQINADISVAYLFEAAKVPLIYVTFRQPPDQIADIYLRAKVRDAFSRHGPEFRAIEIVGIKNGQLTSEVKTDLNKELEGYGIRFDSVAIIGRPRIPPDIDQAINNAITQTQSAIAAQNKVAQVEAEARQKVALAEGDAKSAVVNAQGQADATREKARGDADAMLLNATAEAKSKTMVAASLTPLLVKMEAIDQWKGEVPKYSGGTASPVPFLNLNDLDK